MTRLTPRSTLVLLTCAVSVAIASCSAPPSRKTSKRRHQKNGRPIVEPPRKNLVEAFGPQGDLSPIEPGVEEYGLGAPTGGKIREFALQDDRFLRVLLGKLTQWEWKKVGRKRQTKLPAVIAVLPGKGAGALRDPQAMAKAANLELGAFIGSCVVRRQPTERGKAAPRGEIMPKVYATSRKDTFVLAGYGIARCLLLDRGARSGGPAPLGIRFTPNVVWVNAAKRHLAEKNYDELRGAADWLGEHFPPDSPEGRLAKRAHAACTAEIEREKTRVREATAEWPGLVAAFDAIDARQDPTGRQRAAIVAKLETRLDRARRGVATAQKDFYRCGNALVRAGKRIASDPKLPVTARFPWRSAARVSKRRADHFQKLAKALATQCNPRKLVGYREAFAALGPLCPFGWTDRLRRDILVLVGAAAHRKSIQLARKGDKVGACIELALSGSTKKEPFVPAREAEAIYQAMARFPSTSGAEAQLAWCERTRDDFERHYLHSVRHVWRLAWRKKAETLVPAVTARARELEAKGYLAEPLLLRLRLHATASYGVMLWKPVDHLAKGRTYFGSNLDKALARAVVALEPALHPRRQSALHLADVYRTAAGLQRGFASHFGVDIPSAKSLMAAAKTLGVQPTRYAQLVYASTKQAAKERKLELRFTTGTPRVTAPDIIRLQRLADSSSSFGTTKAQRAINERIKAKKQELADWNKKLQRGNTALDTKRRLEKELAAARQKYDAGKISRAEMQKILHKQQSARRAVNLHIDSHNAVVRAKNRATKEFNDLVREQHRLNRERKFGGENARRTAMLELLRKHYAERIAAHTKALRTAGASTATVEREARVLRFLVGLDQKAPPELRARRVNGGWAERRAKALLVAADQATTYSAAADSLIAAWRALRDARQIPLARRYALVEPHFQAYRKEWGHRTIRRLGHDDHPKAEAAYVQKLLAIGMLPIDRHVP